MGLPRREKGTLRLWQPLVSWHLQLRGHLLVRTTPPSTSCPTTGVTTHDPINGTSGTPVVWDTHTCLWKNTQARARANIALLIKISFLKAKPEIYTSFHSTQFAYGLKKTLLFLLNKYLCPVICQLSSHIFLVPDMPKSLSPFVPNIPSNLFTTPFSSTPSSSAAFAEIQYGCKCHSLFVQFPFVQDTSAKALFSDFLSRK